MALHLSIVLFFTGLTGIHSVTTVSKVSVRAGGSISIPCLYEPEFRYHVKYLCEGYEWDFCTYEVKTNQPKQSSGRYLIHDDTRRRVFTVTINNPMDAHYWCAVERDANPDVKQYFQLSVTTGSPQLYVDHQEITGFTGDDVTINCRYSNAGENQWCRLGGSCVKTSGSIDGTRVSITANVPNVFTVTMRGLRTESSGWYYCVKGYLQMPVHLTVKQRPSTTARQLITFAPTPEPESHTSVSASEASSTTQRGYHSRASVYPLSLIILLSLLLFIVVMSCFVGFILKRCISLSGRSEERSTATTTEQEITYSAVKHKRTAPGERLYAEPDGDVTYSSVVTARQHTGQKVEAEDEGVTYSTLSPR